MNKILHYIYMSLMILVGASCTDDIAESSQAEGDGNMTLLSGKMSTVDLKSVNTRSIDGQSGLGANTMTVFCFDKDGSFLGYKPVNFEGTGNTPDNVSTQVYKFNVNVPSATRRVHFVANQNMTTFNASIGDNERTVMGSLESTSGSLTYWARVAVGDGSLPEAINDKTIPLVRNQAKVRLSGDGAEGVSFVVCNSYLSGRTVPFNASASTGEDPYGYTTDSPFITLSGVTAKTSPKGTTAEEEQYIFENDNDAEDPVFVILEKNGRFYKVLLADAESNMLPIYRNFQYTINIAAGALESLSGSESFQKALEADPCNNPWLYASDKLLKISDGNLTMEIKDLDNTTVIYHNSGTYQIKYGLSVKSGNLPDPTVTWTPEGAAFGQMTHSITDGEGTVTLAISTQLNEGSNTVYRGIIMIKAGRLTRHIKVLYCNKFKFEPVWISTGVANKTGQPVVMMFTVPEEFPEELLPIKCYISTNMLDANGLTPLDIETSGKIDENCIKQDNPNNFYAYYTNVQTKGVQRVYFWTRDIPDAVSDEVVCLSADHFEHMEKTMYFDTDEEDEGMIELVATVPENPETVWIPENINGCAFQYCRDAGTSGDIYTPINYWLLPRKKNSKYALRFRLKDGSEYTNEENVKLRIYTEHLMPDGDAQGLGTPQNAAEGGGRYYSYTTDKAQLITGSDGGDDYFEIKFLAPANCTDVVRIAQEPVDGKHIHYRSVPLEMANFRAFEFNPEDAKLGYDLVSDGERNYVKMAADYGPNNKVEIKFNVSPFRSVQHITDNQGAGSGQLTVKADPGDDFDIYIKTKNLVPEASIGTDVVSQGNGIYKFHYKTGSHATDPTNGGTLDNPGGGNISLPFVTRGGYAVSEETIEIYTSTDEIDYTPLRIDLGNNPMTGSIKFGKEGEATVSVPQDAFLVIMRRDGTRIGRFTMTGEGRYSIQLYSEYNVMWDETVYITYERDNITYWDSGYLSALLTEGEKTGIILTNKEVID